MPSKKTNRKSRVRSRSGSRKSRSPYKYNRRNNLLKQVSKRKTKSRSKTRSKKKSRSKSKSRKRYSSSVPKSRKFKSRSPRKLVDISAFQHRKKSPRYSANDGFQKVQNRHRRNIQSRKNNHSPKRRYH